MPDYQLPINATRRFALALFLVLSGLCRSVAVSGDTSAAASPHDGAVPFALPLSSPFVSAVDELSTHRLITDWYRSAHADTTSPAFTHWNEQDRIPADCARCHSGEGFRDYHGLNGTAKAAVNGRIKTGGVVDCDTCHHTGLASITALSLPSGIAYPLEGARTPCLGCHQGRAAGATIDEAIAGVPLDQPSAKLRFSHPHFGTAAATWLGSDGAMGYQYPDRDYSPRFRHARPVASCIGCHEPHTLRVASARCQACHKTDIPGAIRSPRRQQTGDDGMPMSARALVEANARILMSTLQTYSADIAGASLVYDARRSPYFFADDDADGVADLVNGEAVVYASWTPRSLRAAFNWQLVTADPGSYVHNPRYALELLHDSAADLGEALGVTAAELGLERR